MRRPLLVLALVVFAALAAACSSSTGPGWTYAAPTSPPPSQPAASGSGAPASQVPGSQAPGSEAPGSQAPASGGAGGGGGTVQISAMNVAFEQKDVSAPAGAAFTIHFDNKDAGQPHNINIKDASGASVFKGDLITGPAAVDYQVPALKAGTYTFVCDVHSNMTGTLNAGS
jgi:plastocyanin